jgi:hypothetical protein
LGEGGKKELIERVGKKVAVFGVFFWKFFARFACQSKKRIVWGGELIPNASSCSELGRKWAGKTNIIEEKKLLKK